MIDAAWYAAGAALGATAWGLGGRCPRRAAAPALALALPALLGLALLRRTPAWEEALLPFDAYVFWRGAAFGAVAILVLTLLARLVPAPRDRRALLALAGFVFAATLWTARWQVIPADTTSARTASVDHHCAQSDGSSCAPACCVTFLSYLGVAAAEGEMAGLCRTRAGEGTDLFRIAHALRRKLGGREVRIVSWDAARLRDHGAPAVVLQGTDHAVAVRFDGAAVVVHDPLHPAPTRVPFDSWARSHGGVSIVALGAR